MRHSMRCCGNSLCAAAPTKTSHLTSPREMTPIKPQNSPDGFSRLIVIALLTLLLQISGAGTKPAIAGQPIRGTPIDSPPEAVGLATPADLQSKPIAANLSPTNSLP